MSQWKTFQLHGRVYVIDEVNEDILNLKVVVNTKVKGEDHASWYRMSAYKHNAKFIRQWVNSGDMVLVSGTEYQKTYTNKNGQEVTAPQMNVTKIDVMRKSRDSEQSQGGGWGNQQSSQSGGGWGNSQSQNQSPKNWAGQAQADSYGESRGWGQSSPNPPQNTGAREWGNKPQIDPQNQEAERYYKQHSTGGDGGYKGDDVIPF